MRPGISVLLPSRSVGPLPEMISAAGSPLPPAAGTITLPYNVSAPAPKVTSWSRPPAEADVAAGEDAAGEAVMSVVVVVDGVAGLLSPLHAAGTSSTASHQP